MELINPHVFNKKSILELSDSALIISVNQLENKK